MTLLPIAHSPVKLEAIFCVQAVETTLGAILTARASAGKPKIRKLEGHFHGMHDCLWYNRAAGLGETRTDGTIAPVPDSEGIPSALADLILVAPFNNLGAFDRIVRSHRDELAAVIMEPIWYNQGCIPSDPESVREVRRISAQNGIILIFDEVLSALRMCRGGGQEYYCVMPDLCTLAKALGVVYPSQPCAVVTRSCQC
ncbi:MAG: aminotransferase class III-fold pyridoxal phosphate-dependent enzyme [Terriglobia bacterium]